MRELYQKYQGDEKNREQSRMSLWWHLALAVAAAIIIGFGALDLLSMFGRPLALLLIGGTISAALAPLVYRVDDYIPRSLAILLVYLILALILIGLGWLVVPQLVQQSQAVVDRVPDLTSQLQNWFESLGQATDGSVLNNIASQLSTLGSTVVSLPLTISSALFEIILITFFSIYLLYEGPRLKSFLCSLTPEDRESKLSKILDQATNAMGGYVRGTAIDGVAVGVASYFGFLLIGLEFPLVFAVLSGLMELIPTVGPILSGIIIVGITLLQSSTKALYALIFMVVLQQLENHILVPYVMGKQTNVSPLLVLLALFSGAVVGGAVGALAAIPLMAALHVLVSEVVAPKIRQWTGAEEGGGEGPAAKGGAQAVPGGVVPRGGISSGHE